jgi:cyanophycinase-like exopeptidase
VEGEVDEKVSAYIQVVHKFQILGITGITVVDSDMHTRSNGSVG